MDINIGLKEGFILSIFCILIVFIVLMIISLSVNLIRIFMYKQQPKYNLEVKKRLEENCNIKFEDIKDEDMLIAAFVASIDVVEGNDNKTVKIKRIREI